MKGKGATYAVAEINGVEYHHGKYDVEVLCTPLAFISLIHLTPPNLPPLLPQRLKADEVVPNLLQQLQTTKKGVEFLKKKELSNKKVFALSTIKLLPIANTVPLTPRSNSQSSN